MTPFTLASRRPRQLGRPCHSSSSESTRVSIGRNPQLYSAPREKKGAPEGSVPISLQRHRPEDSRQWLSTGEKAIPSESSNSSGSRPCNGHSRLWSTRRSKHATRHAQLDPTLRLGCHIPFALERSNNRAFLRRRTELDTNGKSEDDKVSRILLFGGATGRINMSLGTIVAVSVF